MKTIRKAVNDEVLIVNDWDEVVSSSSWAMGGLTARYPGYSGMQSSVIADGGVLGTAYKVTNTVVLENNETLERSVMVELVTK